MPRRMLGRLVVLVAACALVCPGQVRADSWTEWGWWLDDEGLLPFITYTMVGPQWVCLPYAVDLSGNPVYTPVTVHYGFYIGPAVDAWCGSAGWCLGPDVTFTAPDTKHACIDVLSWFDEDCPYSYWSRLSKATTAVAIKHLTEKHAPDGTTPDSRTTIGIGETVDLSILPPGDVPGEWSHTNDQWGFGGDRLTAPLLGPNSTPPLNAGDTVRVSLPNDDGTHTVCTVGFAAILPSGKVASLLLAGLSDPDGGDTWIKARDYFQCQWQPMSVCFDNVPILEWLPEDITFTWPLPCNPQTVTWPGGVRSDPNAHTVENVTWDLCCAGPYPSDGVIGSGAMTHWAIPLQNQFYDSNNTRQYLFECPHWFDWTSLGRGRAGMMSAPPGPWQGPWGVPPTNINLPP